MSAQKKKTPAEELMDSLLSEVEEGGAGHGSTEFALSTDEGSSVKEADDGAPTVIEEDDNGPLEGLVQLDPTVVGGMSFEGFLRENRGDVSLDKTQIQSSPAKTPVKLPAKSEEASVMSDFSNEEANSYEATHVGKAPELDEKTQNTEFGNLDLDPAPVQKDLAASSEGSEVQSELAPALSNEVPPVPEQDLAQAVSLFDSPPVAPSTADENMRTQVIATNELAFPPLPIAEELVVDSQVATISIHAEPLGPADGPVFEDVKPRLRQQVGDNDGTVAVTGFQIKPEENLEDKVKVSVGKSSRSSGFLSWGGGVDSNLSQAENLRMAQEKILELENESERLRRQNEELISASEILKERSDLMTGQLTEYKNDREGLEQSFKNEMTLLKNHLARKDAELKKAQFKVEELEARLKFDLKKIRVRERELENRLELVRAEKNAISKNKDEQILDLRRKMDVIQMEVDSYRQKCVELNRQIENSQDSFKRTTRALRLAMANLELQEENKGQLKKAE